MLLEQFVQILYWLALATWFGGVLFVAIAAPIIFRTVREYDPTLPTVLSVNLQEQHATLLAGTIVGNILGVLLWVQTLCAAVLFLALVGQWLLIDLDDRSIIFAALRTALFLFAAILVVYDRYFLWPRIDVARQEYVENADNPDVANPAKERFDRYHRESVTVLSVTLFLLLGMILFSGKIF